MKVLWGKEPHFLLKYPILLELLMGLKSTFLTKEVIKAKSSQRCKEAVKGVHVLATYWGFSDFSDFIYAELQCL